MIEFRDVFGCDYVILGSSWFRYISGRTCGIAEKDVIMWVVSVYLEIGLMDVSWWSMVS